MPQNTAIGFRSCEHTCVYVYIYIYMYIHVFYGHLSIQIHKYIYIYRERETKTYIYIYAYVCIYIYNLYRHTYIYIHSYLYIYISYWLLRGAKIWNPCRKAIEQLLDPMGWLLDPMFVRGYQQQILERQWAIGNRHYIYIY